MTRIAAATEPVADRRLMALHSYIGHSAFNRKAPARVSSLAGSYVMGLNPVTRWREIENPCNSQWSLGFTIADPAACAEGRRAVAPAGGLPKYVKALMEVRRQRRGQVLNGDDRKLKLRHADRPPA